MQLPPLLTGTRPAPQPPPVHARTVLLTGTVLWFVAFVVLLPFWNWLGEHDHRIWLWTCLAGWLLGLVGLAIFRKHRSQGRAVD
jgi:Protein of unknown function (DUF2530)